ncbi:MAG: prepilin peptidase [Pyrinomonadaceae bacterium]|jgi:prepilin peptidase CpaA|nr:prepilin peptidase [Pyrinomonadaceae bacterium]
MSLEQNIAMGAMLIPMAIGIAYMDVRYRRIPNKLVLITLVGGLAINTFFGGRAGLLESLGGCVLAFALMFIFHAFGTMGAGDVKLFAAIGAAIGSPLVLQAFLIVSITGGMLALSKMIYKRRTRTTVFGVLQFFYGLLPGQRVPRFEVPVDRSYTLPYGVAICAGSLIAFFLFRA